MPTKTFEEIEKELGIVSQAKQSPEQMAVSDMEMVASGKQEEAQSQQQRPSFEEIESKIFGTQAQPEQEQIVESQQTPVEGNVGNPLQRIGGEISRGYAQSASGINTKLLALAKVLDNPIIDTDTIQNGLRQNAEFWKQQADAIPYRDNNAWVWNTLGGMPIGVAEFGATKNPVSIIAAAGGLNALNDFGEQLKKDPNTAMEVEQMLGSFVSGAAITGAFVGGLHLSGVALEKMGTLIEKHGKDTVKKMLVSITGNEEKGKLAFELIEKQMVDFKKKLPGLDKTKEENRLVLEQERALLKKQEEELVATHKSDIKQMKDDFDVKIHQTDKELAEAYGIKKQNADAAIKDMQVKNKVEVDAKSLQSKEAIDLTTESVSNSINTAKVTLFDQMDELFNGMIQKTEKLKKAEGELVGNIWDKIISGFPTTGAKTDSVINRVMNLNNLKENSLKFSFDKKGNRFVVNSGSSLPQFTNIAKQVEADLNYLMVSAAERNGVITANELRHAFDAFKGIGYSKMTEGGGVMTAYGRVISELGDMMNIGNYADDVVPGAKSFVQEIINTKKKYGARKDALASAYSKYFKTERGTVVPNVEAVFKRLDSGDERLIRRLRDAEKEVMPEDRVLDKVIDMHKKFKTIEATELNTVKKLKAQVLKEKQTSELAHNEAIRLSELNNSKLLGVEGQAIKDQIWNMKRQNSKVLDELDMAFDSKLKQHREIAEKKLKDISTTFTSQEQLLEVEHILRSVRPQSGFFNVLQNIGLYGAAGAGTSLVLGLNPAVALPTMLAKAGIAAAVAPKNVTKAAEFALGKGKEGIKKAVKSTRQTGESIKKDQLLKKLIASSLIRQPQ